jgi:hypothetical protein
VLQHTTSTDIAIGSMRKSVDGSCNTSMQLSSELIQQALVQIAMFMIDTYLLTYLLTWLGYNPSTPPLNG